MRALFLLLLSTLFILSCGKETETFDAVTAASYLPVKTGKFITYRLDSTVFTNFGTVTTTRSYQEKHQVDATLTDNMNRPAYRVFRFLRDTLGRTAWTPAGSFLIVQTDNGVEVVENNLRYLKLAGPILEGKTWKGNRFLPSEPFGPNTPYNFSNDDNMDDWDYTYKNVGGAAILGGKTYASTITVNQINESANAPVTTPQAYGYINYSVEKYAKDIGLIFQEFIMWEYQPSTTGGTGFKTGFGVKRTIIDNN